MKECYPLTSKKDHNLISIIIPSKNEEKRLPRCIKSIKNLIKDKNDLEIIVVDNGSEDNTVGVAKQLDVNVFIKSSGTVGSLRNYGAKMSKGNILIFLDSDIEVMPDFLIKSIPLLNNKKVAVVTGKILIPKQSTWLEQTWFLNRKKKYQSGNIDWSSSMNMIIKRDVFIFVGGFTDDLVTCEDIDISYKIKNAGYQINYDEKIKVIHFGEAKNISELIKKERWRGYNTITLANRHPGAVNIWLGILQILIINISLLCGVMFFGFSEYKYAILFLLIYITPPLLRAILISIKNNTYKYFHQLFIVWYFYYIARSLALIDRIIYLTKLQFKNKNNIN